jgi:hypothetical protein
MRKFFGALILLSLIFVSNKQARADGPQIFITWSTDGYVPAGYGGKVLPVNGSHLKARVGAFLNGGFLDLSKEEVAWYVNGTPIQDGTGMQAAEFDVSTLTQSSLELKAQLLSLNGGPYSKTINIPIVQPEAVVQFRSPHGNITRDNIFLTALPFFFRVKSASELNFSWQINGETPASLTDPQHLNIKSSSGFLSGSTVQVSLNIQNGAEGGSQSKTFRAP